MTGLDQLPATDPSSLLRYRDGLYAVDFLTAAVAEFRIFDALREEPGTFAGICERFGNVMHDWGKAEILALTRRSRETLAPGGTVLVHEAFLDPDKRGPLPVAEYSCILAHSTRGRCYAWSEMESFLAEAGFRSLGYRPTGGDRGVVAGTVASRL